MNALSRRFVTQQRKGEPGPRVSDKWIGWAEEAMAKKEPPWKPADLARAVGCDRVTVHRLLTKKHWTRWCNEIADALGIAHPMLLVESQEEADWIEAGKVIAEHAPDDFKKWLGRAKELAAAVEERARAKERVDEIVPPDSSDRRGKT
jgi:hypothetical protein